MHIVSGFVCVTRNKLWLYVDLVQNVIGKIESRPPKEEPNLGTNLPLKCLKL